MCGAWRHQTLGSERAPIYRKRPPRDKAALHAGRRENEGSARFRSPSSSLLSVRRTDCSSSPNKDGARRRAKARSTAAAAHHGGRPRIGVLLRSVVVIRIPPSLHRVASPQVPPGAASTEPARVGDQACDVVRVRSGGRSGGARRRERPPTTKGATRFLRARPSCEGPSRLRGGRIHHGPADPAGSHAVAPTCAIDHGGHVVSARWQVARDDPTGSRSQGHVHGPHLVDGRGEARPTRSPQSEPRAPHAPPSRPAHLPQLLRRGHGRAHLRPQLRQEDPGILAGGRGRRRIVRRRGIPAPEGQGVGRHRTALHQPNLPLHAGHATPPGPRQGLLLIVDINAIV